MEHVNTSHRKRYNSNFNYDDSDISNYCSNYSNVDKGYFVENIPD